MRPAVRRTKELASSTSPLGLFPEKKTFTSKDIRIEKDFVANFEVSEAKHRSLLTDKDITKSADPNKIPAIFFKKNAVELSTRLNRFFKNVKRLRHFFCAWKDASLVPVYKERAKQLVKIYIEVSFLNIGGRGFEKCLYKPLLLRFSSVFSRNQYGFFYGTSIQIFVLSFWQNKGWTKTPTLQ